MLVGELNVDEEELMKNLSFLMSNQIFVISFFIFDKRYLLFQSVPNKGLQIRAQIVFVKIATLVN